MMFHYLKIFLRLIRRQSLITLINIAGLAVGLCCCLIIALYVRHELSHDRFFDNSANLYRVSLVSVDPAGVEREGAGIFFPVAPLLEQNFPEIETIARMRPRVSLLSNGDTAFFENDFRLIDPEFFALFDLKWLAGDTATALANPANVVLTRSAATKYFGSEDPLGRTLTMSEGVDLLVSGVIEDLPSNTHLNGSVFSAMSLRDVLEPVEDRTAEWFNGIYYTYVQLPPETDVAAFRQALVGFSRDNIPTASFNILFTLSLDRITNIHLNPKIGELKLPGSKLNIVVFSAIGLAIMLIACINFVNLSTANSTRRRGEVGLRMALGARRSQVLEQFLGESVLFIILSMLLAMGLVEGLLPMVQQWLGLRFELDTLMERPIVLVYLLLCGLGLGLLAGWYPALILSRLNPALVLKNAPVSAARGMALKNILVVVQFAIAIVLIIGSIIIQRQISFAAELDQGFQRDGMVIVRTSNTGSSTTVQMLKDRLLQENTIEAATVSAYTPERFGRSVFVSSETDQTNHRLAYAEIDFDYFNVYGLELLAGRLFRQDMPTDLARSVGEDAAAVNGSFIINQRGAREFGWSPEEAIDKLILHNNGWYRVVGVVSDTIESAQAEIRPAIYAVPTGLNPGRNLTLRVSGNNLAVSLSVIDNTWSEINPGEPIVRSFLDDNIRLLYQTEANQMYLVFLFAALSIVICCMGLFGLASFSTANRTKEIGVRKVMGSSVWQIVLLLTNDFSKLVLISNVIAWPVAYFAMNRWLENFAYRIDLTPLVFIGSGLIALCIAWVTVGGTAAKAASQKPVLALRYE